MTETTSLPAKTNPLLKIGKFFGIVAIFAIIYLASAVATGFISAFSNNIDTTTFTVIFDSQITIAYLLVYYSLSHFYKMSTRANYLLFVATLIMSFTTNFIQGTLTLLLLLPLLKKLRLISDQQ